MNPPLIAIFLPSLRGGGAERAMLVFASELLRRGFSVDLIIGTRTGNLTGLVPPGANVIDFGQSRLFRCIPLLASYLRRKAPSALYSTIVHANVVASLAAKLSRSRVPVVVRESNVPVTEPKRTLSRRITFKLVPMTYGWATGIIAVSEGVSRELSSVSTTLNRLIKVIPTPIVSEDLLSKGDEVLDHPWFQPGEPPVILGVARLQPHKGFIALVRAFAEIRRSQPARLVILGEGPEHDNIRNEAEQLQISSDVELAGFKSNPFPYMKNARVFALTSEYEGLPNVLVQAMAFGTPVVANDCKSGPAEILMGGRYGSLVPVGDHAALVEAIRGALRSPRRHDAAQHAQTTYGVAEATSAYLEMAKIAPFPKRGAACSTEESTKPTETEAA